MKLAFVIQLRHEFPSGFQLNVDWSTAATHVGITGPSGSGKTSFLNAIAGIFKPQKSHITLHGKVFANETTWVPPRNRSIGLVTQDALLYPHLNVAENLSFGVEAKSPVAESDSVVEMLEIGFLLDRRIRHLSGGERQRVALGRALLSAPHTLLLDEPFSAIDLNRRTRIIEKMKEHLVKSNTSLLLVSHDQTVIDALCSNSLHMNSGCIQHTK